MGKCVFNRKWLSDAKLSCTKEFKGDKHKAMFCVRNKVIDIEPMGESTLKSHTKGEKHKRNTSATSSSTQTLLMTGQLTLVTKSNALRKAATEKTIPLQEFEDKLNGKLEPLKSC